MKTKALLATAIVVEVGVTGCPPLPPPSRDTGAASIEIVAPAEFEFARYSNPLLRVHILGHHLDPASTVGVQVFLLTADGVRVEAKPGPPLTLGDVAAGEGDTFFDLRGTPFDDGQYKVCARAEGINASPCDAVAIKKKPGGCQATEAAPAGVKCKCTASKIKGAAGDGAPDPALGSFVPGGNAPGSFDDGNWKAASGTVSSEYKFEAHFTIGIMGAPAKPAGCTAEDWGAILASACSEGQDINRTFHTKIGMPGESHNSKRPDGTGPSVPFDPRPTATMVLDGHGYTSPGDSGDASIVVGKIKDDQDTKIHWLDVPGVNKWSLDDAKDIAPSKKEMYFHSYVHGNTGDKKDNCDCYFSVTSILLNADGTTGASTMGAITCTP